MFDKLDDTIAAISTPHGQGRRGVVRLSGPEAMHIASTMFRSCDGTSLHTCMDNVRLPGHLAIEDGQFLLPAELFIFRAPRSYTRQEVIEVHTVGASAVMALLLERMIELAARQAEPGEFTARAFFGGAMNLAEVEGVAALIHARSDQQLRTANDWIEGRLAREIQQVRESLVDLLSLVEADIDFAEEPIEFINPSELRVKVEGLADELQALLGEARSAERTDLLPRVLLVGKPNVGKSTLMNRLSGMKRSICSPVAGTTRDYLSALVALPGGEVELIDSAGIGNQAKKNSEKVGFFFDREIRHVELVCHVLDLTQISLDCGVLKAISSRDGPVLWVANKADRVTSTQIQNAVRSFAHQYGSPVHVVSALTGEGLGALRKSLNEELFGQLHGVASQRLAINTRHHQAIALSVESLQRAASWCKQTRTMIDCAEWVAADLHHAVNELGVIFGEVSTDDLLNRVFSQFCIGK